MAIPRTMAAILMENFGPAASSLRWSTGVLTPRATGTKVLVRTRAASINGLDCRVREGYGRSVVESKLPVILGRDVAGDVVEVGGAVSDFLPGQSVFGSLSPLQVGYGTHAEYVLLDEDDLARKPENVTYEEAASVPFAALTAYSALMSGEGISEGDSVLIHGGSGGVGTMAIQIAKHLGATVHTTCGPDGIKLVEELGADLALDYTAEEKFWHREDKYDFVLATFGGIIEERSIDVAKPRTGRVACLNNDIISSLDQNGIPGVGTAAARALSRYAHVKREKGVDVFPVAAHRSVIALELFADMLRSGTLKPVLHKVMDAEEEFCAAHDLYERGSSVGKIVLKF